MAERRGLGELEHLILLCVLRLAVRAYGVAIQRELTRTADRRATTGGGRTAARQATGGGAPVRRAVGLGDRLAPLMPGAEAASAPPGRGGDAAAGV